MNETNSSFQIRSVTASLVRSYETTRPEYPPGKVIGSESSTLLPSPNPPPQGGRVGVGVSLIFIGFVLKPDNHDLFIGPLSQYLTSGLSNPIGILNGNATCFTLHIKNGM